MIVFSKNYVVLHLIWTYFGYSEQRVTFCLLARLANTPKLGLAHPPRPVASWPHHHQCWLNISRRSAGRYLERFSSVARAFLKRSFERCVASVDTCGCCQQLFRLLPYCCRAGTPWNAGRHILRQLPIRFRGSTAMQPFDLMRGLPIRFRGSTTAG